MTIEVYCQLISSDTIKDSKSGRKKSKNTQKSNKITVNVQSIATKNVSTLPKCIVSQASAFATPQLLPPPPPQHTQIHTQIHTGGHS
uniref:Uncharacterized protein n=1 Tax=Anguilla anguilla TaxID=7936 RepID=A0A0E9SHH5_ANGAN